MKTKISMPRFVSSYCIDDLSTEEQKAAKKFITDTLNDLLLQRFDHLVNELFDQLRDKRFLKDDTFTFNYSTEISASLLISAIGRAKKRSKKNG